MKLLLCAHCHDIVALNGEKRWCRCGTSYGRYIDNIHAEIAGAALLIGIANGSLRAALDDQMRHGDLTTPMPGYPAGEVRGREFDAWLLPVSCSRITRLTKMPRRNT